MQLMRCLMKPWTPTKWLSKTKCSQMQVNIAKILSSPYMYITIRITIYLHYLLWLMCFPTVYAVQVMTIGEMNYGRMLLDWSFNSSRQSRSGWNHVLLHWFVLFCYCMLLNLMQTCEWKNFKFALFLVTWHLWWFYTCSSYIFMYIYLSIGIWINCTDNC